MTAQEVIVYSKNNCSDCTATKELMDEKGIEYTEINIQEQKEYRDQLFAMGFRQMPVVNVGDDWWSKFNRDKILALVGEENDLDDVWG